MSDETGDADETKKAAAPVAAVAALVLGVAAVIGGIDAGQPSESRDAGEMGCLRPACDGGPILPDCLGVGLLGEADGGGRWRGCNAGPAGYFRGVDCIPTECEVAQ